jgi:hypothetical protein
MAWAIKQHFDWGDAFLGYGYATTPRPIEFAGLTHLLFATRGEARAFIGEHFGYIRKRPDLRAAPHKWTMPRAVQVEVVLKEIS